MGSLFSALLTLITGWSGYRQSQKEGTWSNQVFFLSLAGGLGLFLLVVVPLVALPMATIQQHPLAFFGTMFGGITIGVIGLVLLIQKVKRAELAKKNRSDLSGQ